MPLLLHQKHRILFNAETHSSFTQNANYNYGDMFAGTTAAAAKITEEKPKKCSRRRRTITTKRSQRKRLLRFVMKNSTHHACTEKPPCSSHSSLVTNTTFSPTNAANFNVFPQRKSTSKSVHDQNESASALPTIANCLSQSSACDEQRRPFLEYRYRPTKTPIFPARRTLFPTLRKRMSRTTRGS